MKPVFNNTHNKVYQTDDGDKWHSRACAVVAHVWIKYVKLDQSIEYFVLVGKRGTGGDNIGKLNVPCGYMDWDENLTQATRRELYEETGFDIQDYLSASLRTSIKQPWYVKTDPDENRQNISMHTGILLELDEQNFELPTLSLDNMEDDEVEWVKWLSLDEIINTKSDDWAFKHRERILKFGEYLHDDICEDGLSKLHKLY